MKKTHFTLFAGAAVCALALASCATGTSSDTSPTGDTSGDTGGGTVTLGWLLPQTGPIASLGAPQIAALELAQQEINAAGGILGNELKLDGGDEAGDPAVAGQAVDRLLGSHVNGIIGAGSSSITMSVIDKITGSQVVQCSGMNTTPDLTGYPDDGYYFRTVPSDILQGAVLANQVAEDGGKKAVILARSDSYASGLASTTEKGLADAGIEVTRIDYDPSAQNLDGEVRKAVAADPDSVILFSFDEGAKLLQSLTQNNLGTKDVNLYGTDALPIGSLAEGVDPSNPAVIEGMKFTQASSGEGSDFTKRLEEASGKLETTAFTPYFYDCENLIALAMEQSQSTDPTVYKDNIIPLTRSGGEECSTFAECRDLIHEGTQITYVGAAGVLEMDDEGEPTTGLYDILQMQADGTTTVLDVVRQDLQAQ